MWAMLAAPLIAGNDLRTMSAETAAILTNPGVIAVDQDPLGIQGYKHRDEGEREIWVRPLEGGDWAVAALNRGETPWVLDVNWSEEHLRDDLNGIDAALGEVTYRIVGLWGGEDRGTTAEPLSAEVPGRDVLVFRLERLRP
jgi:alpha-galactosidase